MRRAIKSSYLLYPLAKERAERREAIVAIYDENCEKRGEKKKGSSKEVMRGTNSLKERVVDRGTINEESNVEQMSKR